MKSDPDQAEEQGAQLQRMRDAAARWITKRGIAGFKIREMADELGITPTLPLYYFGTAAGLFGAVAEYGFTQIAGRLEKTRRSGPPSMDRLERIALAHGRYGLEKPKLYQAMHSPSLWGHTARSSSKSSAAGKARHWIERAEAARDAAFAEYVEAVTETQAVGAMSKQPPERIAHLLSAVVDGYLFHVREERILAHATTKEKLDYLSTLLHVATDGVTVFGG